MYPSSFGDEADVSRKIQEMAKINTKQTRIKCTMLSIVAKKDFFAALFEFFRQ
jgi:hypothetical protein